MRVIYVDDEELARLKFKLTAEKIPEIETLEVFDTPYAALEYLKDHIIDAAFLDIEMP